MNVNPIGAQSLSITSTTEFDIETFSHSGPQVDFDTVIKNVSGSPHEVTVGTEEKELDDASPFFIKNDRLGMADVHEFSFEGEDQDFLEGLVKCSV